MRAFVLALAGGAVGGLVIGFVFVGTEEWRIVEKQLVLEVASFVTLWAVLGAIIGGAWEIVTAIKRTRPPQATSTEKKEE